MRQGRATACSHLTHSLLTTAACPQLGKGARCPQQGWDPAGQGRAGSGAAPALVTQLCSLGAAAQLSHLHSPSQRQQWSCNDFTCSALKTLSEWPEWAVEEARGAAHPITPEPAPPAAPGTPHSFTGCPSHGDTPGLGTPNPAQVGPAPPPAPSLSWSCIPGLPPGSRSGSSPLPGVSRGAL